MSRRERVLLVLGLIGAIAMVAYPLAYRISTENASAVTLAASARPLPTSPGFPAPSRSMPPPTEAPPPLFTRIPVDPTALPIDPTWRAVAVPHRGANGKSFEYQCSPNGTLIGIWGTDIYTDDSPVCTAAVHQGVIRREQGGTVTIIIRKGLRSYPGSTRNGVTSEFWDDWDGSYEVVKP